MPHDFQWYGRKRQPDGKLGEADGAAGHQPEVAGRGQHAPAGQRVAVDRGDNRFRAAENGEQRLAERRQELRHVRRPALDDPLQVDARGEAPPGAGEDDGRRLDGGQRAGQRGEQLQVSRVDRAVGER